MLYNTKGQQVQVSYKLDSTSNPRIFAPLREVHEPQPINCGNLFHLVTRVCIIDQRQHSHH